MQTLLLSLATVVYLSVCFRMYFEYGKDVVLGTAEDTLLVCLGTNFIIVLWPITFPLSYVLRRFGKI